MPETCGELLGDDFTLNWDTEDPQSFTAPTWANQPSVGDIGFNMGRVEVEIPKRKAVKTARGGRQEWELTFTMNYARDNAFHMAVIAAIESGDQIHLALADGIIDDPDDPAENLWHAWWFLTGNLGASLDEGATVEITGKVHACAGENDDEDPEHQDLTA